jgi:hypothetical protein
MKPDDGQSQPIPQHADQESKRFTAIIGGSSRSDPEPFKGWQ